MPALVPVTTAFRPSRLKISLDSFITASDV
jgi:hypothetical protein